MAPRNLDAALKMVPPPSAEDGAKKSRPRRPENKAALQKEFLAQRMIIAKNERAITRYLSEINKIGGGKKEREAIEPLAQKISALKKELTAAYAEGDEILVRSGQDTESGARQLLASERHASEEKMADLQKKINSLKAVVRTADALRPPNETPIPAMPAKDEEPDTAEELPADTEIMDLGAEDQVEPPPIPGDIKLKPAEFKRQLEQATATIGTLTQSLSEDVRKAINSNELDPHFVIARGLSTLNNLLDEIKNIEDNTGNPASAKEKAAVIDQITAARNVIRNYEKRILPSLEKAHRDRMLQEASDVNMGTIAEDKKELDALQTALAKYGDKIAWVREAQYKDPTTGELTPAEIVGVRRSGNMLSRAGHGLRALFGRANSQDKELDNLIESFNKKVLEVKSSEELIAASKQKEVTRRPGGFVVRGSEEPPLAIPREPQKRYDAAAIDAWVDDGAVGPSPESAEGKRKGTELRDIYHEIGTSPALFKSFEQLNEALAKKGLLTEGEIIPGEKLKNKVFFLGSYDANRARNYVLKAAEHFDPTR